MSIKLEKFVLNGPTMGTRWSAIFYALKGFETVSLEKALQAAVHQVDTEMSTRNPDSALMQINRAPVGDWVSVPDHLMTVLHLALCIGRASEGAFDIGLGDAVQAWGFGANAANPTRIREALSTDRLPAHDAVELNVADRLFRKRAPISLDLNGIAKGYGVDRLAETLEKYGISSGLVGIDGEMRSLGLKANGEPWVIAVEEPIHGIRSPHSVIALQDAAVATSGDYRHWIDVGSKRLSHTMDPAKGAPLQMSPASVTVVAETCAEADAWATVLMVLGAERGRTMAVQTGLDAMFLQRCESNIVEIGVGPLFAPQLLNVTEF